MKKPLSGVLNTLLIHISFVMLATVFITSGLFAQGPGGVSTNLNLWLRGNVGLSGSGTQISGWADQSGNGNNFSQPTAAKQPTLISPSPAFNGYTVVDFDMADDAMISTDQITGRPYSFFVVYNSNSTAVSGRRAIAGSNNWLIGPYNNTATFYAGSFVETNNIPVDKRPFVSTALSSSAASNNAFFYYNGKNSVPAGVTSTGVPGFLNLGAAGFSAETLGGSIAEVIAYTGLVTPMERNKIESYLAIKYGITLDQVTPTDYNSTTGVTFWSAAANGIYKNNIFGIGSDGVLNQSRSVSVNTSRISIRNPSALVDGDFLMLSDNGLSSFPLTQGGLPGGATYASQLVWNVSKTAFAGATVRLDITSGLANPILMIDNDNNGSYELSATPTSVSGNVYTFTGVLLNNQAKVSLGYATAPVSPGGISSGLKLWLKANAGVTTSGSNVTIWADQSAEGNNATLVTGTNPILNAAALNGNPVVKLTGAGALTGDFNTLLTSSNSSAFIVTRAGVANNSGLFSMGNATTDFNNNFYNLMFVANNTTTSVKSYRGVDRGSYANANAVSDYHLYSSIFNATQNLFYNEGKAATNAACPQTPYNVSKYSVGGYYSSGVLGSFNSGEIAEIILYDNVTGTGAQQQVQSYLAIKYGITIDQTVATNYTNSAGAIVWNAATNGSYKNNIFGIGRDDASALNQTEAKSINTDRISIANASALANDDYLFISDNNLSPIPVATPGLPGGALYKTPLTWNATKVGFGAGTVDITVVSNPAAPVLLLDNNNDGTYETSLTASSIAGTSYTFAGIALNNQAKFALGFVNPPVAPGGVSPNLVLWFNAGAGVATSGANVTSWADQSYISNNASNVVGTNPTLSGTLNGNPLVSFGGAGGLYGTFFSRLTTNKTSAFIVTKAGLVGNGGIFAIGNGTTDFNNNAAGVLFIGNAASNKVGTFRSGSLRGNQSFPGDNSTIYVSNHHMFTSVFNATQNLFYTEGVAATPASFAQQNFDAGRFSLGYFYSGGAISNAINGQIAEAILYDREISGTEKQQVESYLAIKYGFTLNSNYLNGIGNIVWNIATNAGYNNDITGIGKDPASGFNQSSSVSIKNYLVKISNPSVLNNNDYLLFGSTNKSITDKSTDVPGGFTQRTEKIWKVAKTGNPGTVTLKFYVGSFLEITPATLSQCALLISNSSSFAGATPVTTGMTLSGAANDTLTFTNVSLNDGNYFALAMGPTTNLLKSVVFFGAPEANIQFKTPRTLFMTAAAGTATVVVDQPGNSAFIPLKATIASGTTFAFDLSNQVDEIDVAPGNLVVNKGLRITSYDNPTTGYYQKSQTSDIGTFPLKGTAAPGLEFYVPGQNYFNSYPGYAGLNTSEVIITATVDNAVVTITPKGNVLGHPANIPFNITLNKGQSYQLQEPQANSLPQLSGTHIVSTQPVVVTYYDELLQVGGAADNAGDQLVPVTKLGSSYAHLRSNLSTTANERIFIVATQNNTSVTIFDGTTTTPITLSSGQTTSYSLPAGVNAAYISSDKAVATYQVGGDGAELGGGIVPPLFTCSGSPSVSFFRSPTMTQVTAMVIVPAGAEGGFTVNGSSSVLVAADFLPVPGLPAWKYARKNISASTPVNTTLRFANSIASFHLGFGLFSFQAGGGGGDFCYFSEFATVPVDYGDLPATWPLASANTAGCATVGGATLSNANVINTSSVWAGNAIDFEEFPKLNSDATADLNDDGLVIPPIAINSGYTYNFGVKMNSNNPGKTVYYRLWFDWNNDGNFANDLDGNGAPATYSGSGVTNSVVTVTVPVKPPFGANPNYKVRLMVNDVAIDDEYRTLGANTVMNMTNGEVEDYTAPAVILPVTFGELSIQNQNCQIAVNFETYTEINAKHFVIEHSLDANNWLPLYTIPAAGNSNIKNAYHFVHLSPKQGANYYRIKAVDKNGQMAYSGIAGTKVNCIGKMSVFAYPNPFNQYIMLTGVEAGSSIELLDGTGKVLMQQKAKGNSTEQLKPPVLVPGMYLLKVRNANGKVTTIKMNKND